MAFAAAALPFIAAATAAAGTVISAVGAIQAGNAQKQAEDYNAQVAKVQGINAQNQATAQAQQVDQENRRKLAQAAAAYGAAGIDATGSPLDVMSDLATQGELTRQLTIYRGTVAAQADQQQAAIDTATGKNAAAAGITKAAGSLLTGFGQESKQLTALFPTTGAGSSPLAAPG